MKIFVSLLFLAYSICSYATLNQSNWKPGKAHRCGFNKFKCPKAGGLCIKRPKKSKCQVVKVGIKKSIKYRDYCKDNGYTCGGSYKSCIDGEYSVSMGSEVNPYAACAP